MSMNDDLAKRLKAESALDPARPLASCKALVQELYSQSKADRWGLSAERFAAAIERSVKKRFTTGPLTPQSLHEYLRTLHIEDLSIAAACTEGSESAWEHFVATYRGYLRSAAAAILRRDVDSAEACEVADSLFAELYGLASSTPGERSLFRYFHGRSSLKTWLRAVLAQRHVDSIRVGRRFEDLGDEEARDAMLVPQGGPSADPPDPHRERYLRMFTRALQTVLEQLGAREKEKLHLYYVKEKTLAEIGRVFGEHESSISRHLERLRRELREGVEEILRCGSGAANGSAAIPGLSEAEITLCFDYAAEDVPFDLEKLFPQSKTKGQKPGKQQI